MFTLRRIIWITGIIAVLGTLGVSTAYSYLMTARRLLFSAVDIATPLTVQIERLKEMCERMQQQIQRNQAVAAGIDVQIETHEDDVRGTREMLERGKREMMRLKDLLASEQTMFVLDGKSYSRKEVETDLERRLIRYEELEKLLEEKLASLEHKRTMRAEIVDRIRHFEGQRELLVHKIQHLELQLAAIQSTEGTDPILDVSLLNEAQQLAHQVDTRLRVMERQLRYGKDMQGSIPVEKLDQRPVVERLKEKFGEQSDTASSPLVGVSGT